MEYNLENFKKELLEIEREAEERKNKVRRLYAQENNPYKIGDIISDHIGSLKIERINYEHVYSQRLPECVYYGIELKKDGITPLKKQTNRPVYQSNIGR